MQDFSHGIIIYAIYVLIGFLGAAWVTFKDYQAGHDLTVSDIPILLLFTFLAWPIFTIVSIVTWLGDNFGKIEDFVLIKGKRNESKQRAYFYENRKYIHIGEYFTEEEAFIARTEFLKNYKKQL